MLINRPKDPNKVKAGQARQRQLREQLGEQGYREYQQAQYAIAIATHGIVSGSCKSSEVSAFG